MKYNLRKGLFLLMAILCVGWVQAQTNTIYVSPSGDDGNQGTTGSPVKTLAKAFELATSGGETIQLAAGTYTENSALTIKKSVTIEGQDSTQTTIKGIFDIDAENAVVAFKNITLTAATATGRGVVDIKSSNTTVSFENSKVVIEESGYDDNGSASCFGVVSQFDVDKNAINFDHSRMVMTGKFQRALAFRDGAGHTINFTNSKLEGPASRGDNTKTIGICAWPGATECTDPVTFNISNSLIDICYYGVFTNNQTNIPVNINIDKSSITAWSALYMRGDGVENGNFAQTVKITESQLNGRSFFNGSSDGFGTIVCQLCPNINFSIDTNSSITCSHLDPKSNPITYYAPFDLSSTQGQIAFIGNGSRKSLVQTHCDIYTNSLFFIQSYDPDEDGTTYPESNIVISGIDNTTLLNAQGQQCVQIYDSKGAFKTAVTNLSLIPSYEVTDGTNLYSIQTVSDGDQVFLPAGTYELSEQLVVDYPVTIKGAGVDQTIIKATKAEWTTTQSFEKNLVSIEDGTAGQTVTLKDLTISNSQRSGLNVQTAMNTVLNNVKLSDNTGAGMVVHSAVNAKGLHTSQNGWGGVNIDNGSPSFSTLKFVFDATSTFDEKEGFPQIWSELGDKEAAAIVTLPNNTWRAIKNEEVNKWYWTNINMTQESVGDVTYVYANGYEVTVEANGTDKTNITSGSQTLTFANDAKVYLFGGSKDDSVENTNITMNSGSLTRVYGGGYKGNAGTTNVSVTGGTITSYLVGGGYGMQDASADVTKATLVISNANVYYLVAGGYEYAKVEETNVTSNNSTYTWVLGGGFAPTKSGNNLETPYENNANNVANSTLNITGGQINGALCAGGGFSYAYVKTATTTLDDVTINGGLYGAGWNGRTETATVNVNGCTFKHKPGENYRTTAALVRGRISSKLDMIFDENCKFDSDYEVYLGADRDNEDYPAPYAESVQFTFKGSSLPIVKVSEGMRKVVVEGAPVIMDKFEHQASSDTWVTNFDVPEYKFWHFYSDVELTADITTNGRFYVGGVCKVATTEQLQAVLNDSKRKIELKAGNYGNFTIPTNDVFINGSNEAVINGTITMNQAYYVSLTGLQLNPTVGQPAIVTDETTILTASKNYWGGNPDFKTLISGSGEANPYPYYRNATMTDRDLADQEIEVNTKDFELPKIYEGCNLVITSEGSAILKQANAHFGTVIINEGGQLTPPTYNAEETGRAIADRFVFNPTLENKWKALGTPFTAQLKNNLGDKADLFEETAETGIWFAGLVDGKPEIEVKKTYTNAGLWAANDKINYGLHAQNVTLESKAEPTAPTSGLQMCVNPNTYNIQLNQSAYVLNKAGTVFELQKNPEIKAFQSFVLADSNTTATLRSIGTTDPNATGNEFVVKEGYYLTTERGAIVVHTAEPMELYVVAVSGAVVYRGTVADGERIAVPTGFYAVNGQMVRVK